jgi:dihydrofolate reductase
MSKVVVSQFVTVDGVIEDPGGSENFERGGWAFQFDRGDEGNKFKLDEVMAAEALLLGRKTYEGFAAAWPGRKDDAGFADKFNSMPKYVASTTLKQLDWNNSHLLGNDVPAAVRELKEQDGGDIAIHGSRTLVQSLMAHDLIDEFRLMVHPIVLGTGLKLFDGASLKNFELVDTKTYDTGTIVATYAPAKDAR